jgi:hypothetical protein
MAKKVTEGIMENVFDISLEPKNAKDSCKGKIYRGRVNAFLNAKKEYVYQERMVPLIRQSCPGCEACGWLEDELKESIGNNALPIMSDIEHEATYRLEIVNQSRDHETGMIDDYDMEFIKVPVHPESEPSGCIKNSCPEWTGWSEVGCKKYTDVDQCAEINRELIIEN